MFSEDYYILQVFGMDNWAAHYIMVDGSLVTYTNEHDAAYGEQSSSTSIVMHLEEGNSI